MRAGFRLLGADELQGWVSGAVCRDYGVYAGL